MFHLTCTYIAHSRSHRPALPCGLCTADFCLGPLSGLLFRVLSGRLSGRSPFVLLIRLEIIMAVGSASAALFVLFALPKSMAIPAPLHGYPSGRFPCSPTAILALSVNKVHSPVRSPLRTLIRATSTPLSVIPSGSTLPVDDLNATLHLSPPAGLVDIDSSLYKSPHAPDARSL